MDNQPIQSQQQQQPGSRKQAVRKTSRGGPLLSLKKKSDDFKNWDIDGDYKFEKMLGQGSYGQVAQAIQLTTGKRVAIKKLCNLFEDETDCKRVLREITLLRQLSHPCVVQLIEVCTPKDKTDRDTIYMVMEYAESDMKKLLKSNISLEIIHIQTIVYNLLCAIKYLHECKVLHRDIKPANILVNEDCTIKLCDYGLARSISNVNSADLIIKACDVTTEKENREPPVQQILKLAPQKQNTKASTEMSDSPNSEDKNNTSEFLQVNKDHMKERLIKTKDLRKNMSRQLTGHVVTRWYRAPEIILMEKDYGPAIDMWGVGCIFAELLSMMKENAPTFLDRKPLFPGKSCFPLSPAKEPQEERSGFPFSDNDQLAKIFQVIGTPTEDDRSFVTDQKALDYLDTFTNAPRADLGKKYPGAPADAIDFLDRILQFNPYFRLTLQEAIEHPLFDGVRGEAQNCIGKPIGLKFDEKQNFADPLSIEEMFQLFQLELNYWKK